MSPALVAALLLLAPAEPTARPHAPGRLGAAEQDLAGRRVELTVRFPPWLFTGTFTLAGAGLTDRGAARDGGSLTAAGATVERVLTGERGSLVLTLRGELHATSFPPLFGHWQVAGGTGAYAGASGGGTFTATDLGTGKGSLLEHQVLVGRLRLAPSPPAFGPANPPARPVVAPRPVGPSPER